ncbi:MAG: right-handed parallel beta-helix repeat-containing protein, partial [Lachnospiraceae bacterium]|nr:right-handed parallel beta-helix repeat-containing protein [Lachnospiraceae bacterium]
SRDRMAYFAYREDKIEPVVMEEEGDSPKNGRSSIATSRWSNGLIRAMDAENIAVVGEKGSYFDGCNCYDPEGEQNYRGPHGMSIWRCRNIRLEGYTFLNSSNWCHAIFQSRDITVRGVSIYGGFDGVDIRSCDNVLVEDCVFNTGDDCIAGFDNNDVVVRNSILNTACMPLRLGGNNILCENCVSDERNFGSRRWMTDEEMFLGELTSERDRHESHAPYSYYCDHRADIRKTPGNIVIRNCTFAQEHELIRIEYDTRHRFCCNRPLRDIRLENCTVSELIDTGMIWGDAKEKVSVYFKNVRISCRKGHEHTPLLVACNYERIVFEDCTIEGCADPTILTASDDRIDVIRSTPVTVKRATIEECFAAHPGGIHSGDRGKNLVFI